MWFKKKQTRCYYCSGRIKEKEQKEIKFPKKKIVLILHKKCYDEFFEASLFWYGHNEPWLYYQILEKKPGTEWL